MIPFFPFFFHLGREKLRQDGQLLVTVHAVSDAAGGAECLPGEGCSQRQLVCGVVIAGGSERQSPIRGQLRL